MLDCKVVQMWHDCKAGADASARSSRAAHSAPKGSSRGPRCRCSGKQPQSTLRHELIEMARAKIAMDRESKSNCNATNGTCYLRRNLNWGRAGSVPQMSKVNKEAGKNRPSKKMQAKC